MKALVGITLSLLLVGCIEPDNRDNISKGKKKKKKENLSLTKSHTDSDLATKNFLQVNNTFSRLTGISPQGDILNEYRAIMLQLPSSSDPKTLNGFNQIASTRLAFAYCDQYIDDHEAEYNFNSVETNEVELRRLANQFADFDFDKNAEHSLFLDNLLAILSDEDELIDDNDAARKKRKLMKMSCSAALSSTYVTLL